MVLAAFVVSLVNVVEISVLVAGIMADAVVNSSESLGDDPPLSILPVEGS
jgi:hypothetical protein